VTVLTTSSEPPFSTYSSSEGRHNASAGSSSLIIFLPAILVTHALIFKFSILSTNSAVSLRYLTIRISRRAFSAASVGPKCRRACSQNTCQNSYPSCFVYPNSHVSCLRSVRAKGGTSFQSIGLRAYWIRCTSSSHWHLFRQKSVHDSNHIQMS